MLARLALVAVALNIAAASAQACISGNYQYGSITLTGEGQLKREFGNSETHPNTLTETFTLQTGDSMDLEATPYMLQDTNFSLKVKLVDQKKDEEGVINSTYDVTEKAMSWMAPRGSRTTISRYKVVVNTNYMGNGTYAKGLTCGEPKKTKIGATVRR